MTWALAIAAAACLAVAGTSNDWTVYLWAPGIFLGALAFHRAIRPRPDPRPGYIHDRKDQ